MKNKTIEQQMREEDYKEKDMEVQWRQVEAEQKKQ
jgi:hypothetical protein